MIISGLVAAPLGVIHIWWRIDYWSPPELFFFSIISLEDMIFGFVSTGISFTIYDAIFTKEKIKLKNNKKKTYLSYCLIIIASFFLLNNGLGLNSMFMFSIPTLAFSAIMIIQRKDLLVPSILSGFLSVIIVIPLYIILFNYIAPNYWNTYWHLADTKLGLTIFGNVPVLELLWYFSWGCFAGISYDFAKGTKNSKNNFEGLLKNLQG